MELHKNYAIYSALERKGEHILITELLKHLKRYLIYSFNQNQETNRTRGLSFEVADMSSVALQNQHAFWAATKRPRDEPALEQVPLPRFEQHQGTRDRQSVKLIETVVVFVTNAHAACLASTRFVHRSSLTNPAMIGSLLDCWHRFSSILAKSGTSALMCWLYMTQRHPLMDPMDNTKTTSPNLPDPPEILAEPFCWKTLRKHDKAILLWKGRTDM